MKIFIEVKPVKIEARTKLELERKLSNFGSIYFGK